LPNRSGWTSPTTRSTSILRRASSGGADPNECGGAVTNPLQQASEIGNVAIIRLLLDKGAKVDATCTGGRTALIAAVDRGRAEAAALLVERGANVNAKMMGGVTALMTAAERGRVDMVKLLVASGADVRAQDDLGSTALDKAVSSRRGDVVQLLTGKPVDPALLKSGYKELMDAAFAGNVTKVAELLDAGADVNIRVDGTTVLERAVLAGRVDVVTVVLDRGADANRASFEGRTPLMFAAQSGSADITRALLLKGADRNARNVLGQNALDIARRNGHPPVVALLTSPTVAPVPPKTRAQINDELVSAVIANDLDRAKAAIARGADVNAKALDVDMTPLIVAASAGGQPMVEWLLEKGADVNAANKAGQTALILAASGYRTVPGGTRGQGRYRE